MSTGWKRPCSYELRPASPPVAPAPSFSFFFLFSSPLKDPGTSLFLFRRLVFPFCADKTIFHHPSLFFSSGMLSPPSFSSFFFFARHSAVRIVPSCIACRSQFPTPESLDWSVSLLRTAQSANPPPLCRGSSLVFALQLSKVIRGVFSQALKFLLSRVLLLRPACPTPPFCSPLPRFYNPPAVLGLKNLLTTRLFLLFLSSFPPKRSSFSMPSSGFRFWAPSVPPASRRCRSADDDPSGSFFCSAS